MDEFDIFLIVLFILGVLRFLYPKLFNYIKFDYTKSFNKKYEKFIKKESGLTYNLGHFFTEYRDGILIKIYFLGCGIVPLLLGMMDLIDIMYTFLIIWNIPILLMLLIYLFVPLIIFFFTFVIDLVRSLIKNL